MWKFVSNKILNTKRVYQSNFNMHRCHRLKTNYWNVCFSVVVSETVLSWERHSSRSQIDETVSRSDHTANKYKEKRVSALVRESCSGKA